MFVISTIVIVIFIFIVIAVVVVIVLEFVIEVDVDVDVDGGGVAHVGEIVITDAMMCMSGLQRGCDGGGSGCLEWRLLLLFSG